MVVTNLLTKISFSSLGSAPYPTTWDLTPTYPNGILDITHLLALVKYADGSDSGLLVVPAFDNTNNHATFTIPGTNVVSVEFTRTTPRYSVFLDPKAPTSRVSQRNLQVNADQGLFTAVEWAAQFGIDTQQTLLADPGSAPNTLGLQQQTQNYWTKADYSKRVWNFSFAGGYIARSHVCAQVLLSTGWTLLEIDTAEEVPQYCYVVDESSTDNIAGPFDLNEDGFIEQREETAYDNDPNISPFRFIGPYQLYMDFSVLPEVPQALIIFRHTPRNVQVNSPVDAARITADGMDASARHALFVAVEIGEQLSQYAPTCDCHIGDTIQTLRWDLDANHTDSHSITLAGSPYVTYTAEMRLTGAMETRFYTDHPIVVGAGGRFVKALSRTGGDPFNFYEIVVSDPPAKYYVNARLTGEGNFGVFRPDGSDAYLLTIQVKGNATITFNAGDVDGSSNFVPQFGEFAVKVVGSNG